jgi:transcriptional regulator with XRE-family HTH domain
VVEYTFPKAFGSALRQLREAKGVSQEWLAEKSGLHPTYVGLVERGGRNPTLKASQAMALALSTPLSNLVAQAEKQQEAARK